MQLVYLLKQILVPPIQLNIDNKYHSDYINILMKEFKTIFYYFLIILSCFLVALALGQTEFLEVIITLCYVYIAVFALLTLLIKRFQLSLRKLLFVKLLFLIFCAASTFFALRVTDEMLFEHELKCPAESVKIKSISIERDWFGSGPYLRIILFEISYDDFLDITHQLDLKKVDISENFSQNITLSLMPDKLVSQTDESSAEIHFFSNENSSNPKTIFYDTETHIAYYEHLNHNGRGG